MPTTESEMRRLFDLFVEQGRELDRLRAALHMIADAFDDWEKPTQGAGREWCDRFSTYLRGNVIATAAFTPEQWAEVEKWMTPNAPFSGERSESAATGS